MTATADTAAAPFEVDDVVTFTPEAGGARVGLHYIVDRVPADSVDASNGKQLIWLKRKVGSRWGYRFGYASDLVKVAQ
jgi:hypothetical protein